MPVKRPKRRFEVKINRHGAKKRQDRQQIFLFRDVIQENPLAGLHGVSWRRGGSILVAAVLTVACAPKSKEPVCPTTAAAPPVGIVVGPDGSLPAVTWTDEELGKDVAIKTVRQSDGASYHVVRLLKAEKPHVHDRSDLVVVVLSGSVKMHFGDRVVPVGPGQVIDIPKGAPHWAENASAGPSFAYVVFAPAFDGKDRRPVEDSGSPQGASH